MPRIYVASLSDYNAGNLHGAWIDVDGKDEDEINKEIQEMLAESRNQPAEEYAIHDYEDFSGIKIGEYESIDTIAALAEAIEDHGEAFALVYADYNDIDSAITAVKDRYCGEYDSMEEYAEEFYNDCYEIPDHLKNYIDYEAIARDLSFEMSVYESESGKVHVFHA